MVPAAFQDRLRDVLRKTQGKVGPEVARQLETMIEPKSLAIMAGVLLLWAGGHAFGVGEAIDLIVGVVGFVAIGGAIFEGLDELLVFGRGTYTARSDADLDAAAAHLAKAIGLLGIQAVLAMLFPGRPSVNRGERLSAGREPPRAPGRRYRPTTAGTVTQGAGGGATTFWGDMTYSTLGTAEDQRLVFPHEKMHQFLAPKLYFMRGIRVTGRVNSYFKSSLYRWFEEMLAETFARMRVLGYNPKQVWLGMSFPVRARCVHLIRGGGYNQYMAGKGLLTEGAALIGTIATAEFPVEIYSGGPIQPQGHRR